MGSQSWTQLGDFLLGFPDSPVGKESACNAGDPSLIPGLGRSVGEEIGHPLQYSGLENSMNCIVHGVAESDMTEQLALCNKRNHSSEKPMHCNKRVAPYSPQLGKAYMKQ